MTTQTRFGRHFPSPREIEQRCVQIQSEWSPAERFWRIVRQRPPWLFPQVQLLVLPLDPIGRRRAARI